MINKNQKTSINVISDDWTKAKCDKYDYMIAAFCGSTAGLVDVFFVGDPLTSVLGEQVDKVADGFVQKAAQFFWKNDQRTTGKRKKMPQSLEECISYLEQAFPVNYDAMIIVGDATLCLVDGVDAAAHGIIEGNVVSFICHLNLVGWIRLVMLVLKELRVRYGSVAVEAIDQFVNKILEEVKSPAEKQRIKEFYLRLEAYEQHLAGLLAEFIAQVEKEYYELYVEIDATFDENSSRRERANHSVKLAQISGVSEDRIVKSRKELDDLFA